MSGPRDLPPDLPPDETGIGAALEVLGRLDPAAYAEVLDHHAALTYLVDLLGDDEEVTWLHVARMRLAHGAGGSGTLAGVLVVTDQRLIFMPVLGSGFPVGLWPLDQLSSLSLASSASAQQRLDVAIAGVRLVLLVRGQALAEATAGVLAEYLPPSPASRDVTDTHPPRVVDELTKWANLWRMGALTDAEYEHKKAELLGWPEQPG